MKAILYCRKSSESEDRQVMSLDAQETELLKVAKRDGIEVVATLRESMSAKSPGRPLFTEMLGKLSRGDAEVILCWKLDRLARNPVDGGTISWLLQQNQIKAIVTHERTYLPADNVLLMSVEFGMSNQYIRDLSVNVKRGNREKLRRGEWPNKAPYGYRNDKNTRTLTLHEAEAEIIRQCYSLYNSGDYSFNDVAKEVGLYKSQVERILGRPFYYGVMYRDGNCYPGKHEQIITKNDYDLAQQVKIGVRVSPIRPKAVFFPYRGFMQCAECGCQLTATKKKGRYDYYYCTNGKGICSQHKTYLGDKATLDLSAQVLKNTYFDEEFIEILYQAAKERYENGQPDTEKPLTDISLELEQISRQERKLLHSFTSELIDETVYRDEVFKLKQKKADLEQKQQKYSQKNHNGLVTLELTKEVFLTCSRAISEFEDAPPERKHEILKTLLWNFSVKDKKVLETNFKSPYHVLANAPKNGDLTSMLPDKDSNLDTMDQNHVSYH